MHFTNDNIYYILKAFFRNVMFQTQRNAKVVASVATYVKLLSFRMRQATVTVVHGESDLLRVAASALMINPITFTPLLNHFTIQNPEVDINILPSSAKVSRRRSSLNRPIHSSSE